MNNLTPQNVRDLLHNHIYETGSVFVRVFCIKIKYIFLMFINLLSGKSYVFLFFPCNYLLSDLTTTLGVYSGFSRPWVLKDFLKIERTKKILRRILLRSKFFLCRTGTACILYQSGEVIVGICNDCGLSVESCVCQENFGCAGCEFFDYEDGCLLEPSVACVKEEA